MADERKGNGMKEIVSVIYHDCNKEARSMEMINCMRMLGHVHYVSYAAPANIDDVVCHLIDKSKVTALFDFLHMAKKTIIKVQPDIVFLHDNDCAILIPFIQKRVPKARIIYDSSELYIDEIFGNGSRFRGNGFKIWVKQKLTAFRPKSEKKYLKNVDIVIAANTERAEKMKEYFELNSTPVVFDNIHRINDTYDQTACDQKFFGIVRRDKFNILFGGGIDEERRTFDFINDFLKLDNGYNLVIAGSASDIARKKYEEMISTADQSRIHYIGFISRAELRYLFRNCQASVVVFDTNSFNTLYCASGKCYESLFEGTTIIASENPPLKRLCTEEGVGISNDDFACGIQQMYTNYSEIKSAVTNFLVKINYEKRVEQLTDVLKNALLSSSEESSNSGKQTATLPELNIYRFRIACLDLIINNL